MYNMFVLAADLRYTTYTVVRTLVIAFHDKCTAFRFVGRSNVYVVINDYRIIVLDVLRVR